jgi:hypothetical protein
MTTAPKSTSPIRPLVHATSLDVTSLNASASSSLPTGFAVERIDSGGSAAEIYEWTGSQWEDGINGGPVSSTSITGTVRFANPSSTDISFAW